MGLEALYLLLPASVVLALTALVLFVWAIHSGQFDDLETPAIRILFEDGTQPGSSAGSDPDGVRPPGQNSPPEPAIPAGKSEG